MKFSSADLSTILNRILDTAADNFRIAKILIQLGLDPDNITYDALFNRLLEVVLANITLASTCALMGSIFYVATLLMRTMVPLRISNDQQRILHDLRRTRRRHKNFSHVSTVSAYQWRSPLPDAQSREDGAKRHQRRQVDGMAQAFHDRAQISQGRQIV